MTFGLGNRCSILLSYGTVRRDVAHCFAACTAPENRAVCGQNYCCRARLSFAIAARIGAKGPYLCCAALKPSA